MAPVCKFFQQGNCRNGSNCRFEHTGANNTNPFGAPSANTNRFTALNSGGSRPQDSPNPYKITRDSIKVDLADERPTWILSCYGPGRDAPEQLFGGYPREQSLEEVMIHIRGSADQQQAMAEVTGLYQQAEQQIQTTLGNLDGAVQFVLAGENNHPNRIDVCKQNTQEGGTRGMFARDAAQGGGGGGGFSNPLASNPSANQNPFSSTPQANPFGGGAPSFGQPSSLGQKPSAFGSAPSTQFGQPSQMGATAPALGQASQMGAAAPAFGQSSQMGAAAPAFGQASTLGQKPNPFGAASSGPSGFAQAGQSAFGQPSALGQRPNPFRGASTASPSPFSQPSAAATSSPFGQPSATAAATALSPFGQPTTTASPSPFAQPAAPSASPFGQVAASNPFSQGANAANDQSMDTTAPTPAASKPNPFGQPSSSSGFGAPSNNALSSQPKGFAAPSGNPFGQPQPQQPPAQAQAPAQTNAAAKTGPYAPNSTKQHPPLESYINKAANGRVLSFYGQQPVTYKFKVNDRYQEDTPRDLGRMEAPIPGVRGAGGTWKRIFFSDGPPSYNKDTEPEPSMYSPAVQAAYATMAATGRFDGDMPEVPPMREDCLWNF